MSSPEPPADREWWDGAVVPDDVIEPGNGARHRIVDEVPGDRDGPAARRLLSFVTDRRPAVRRTATALLVESCGQDAWWPALGAAIRADLDAVRSVPGPPAGRTSWSVGERWAAAFDRLDREHDCSSWAERLLDPVESPAVRMTGIALAVEAMRTWRAAPARLVPTLSAILHEEPSPVRAAAVRALSASTTATRLAADRLATVLDDPELGAVAAVALGCIGDLRVALHLAQLMRAGSREPGLGQALTALAPDSAALVVAARSVLAAHPDPCPLPRWECPAEPAMHVLTGARQGAAEAVPELMARVQSAMDRGDPDSVIGEISALRGIGPAARAAVPLVQRYAATGAGSADLAVHALLMITSDRAVADRFLAERPEQLRRCRIAPALLSRLLNDGGLTDRQHRQLRHLFAQPGAMQLATAGALWRHEGPGAAADLLAELPKYLRGDVHGVRALEALAAMGMHARPVLDLVDGLIRSPWRAGFNVGGADAEMRADEALLTAALTARDHIAG